MNPHPDLAGLNRLMEICHRLDLRMKTAPPGRSPPKAGTLVEGLPLDPVLAALYTQQGYIAFALDVADIVISRYDDEQQLLEDNKWWSSSYRQQLALQTLVFASEPLTAYKYATVPSLADTQGRQPVVLVDVYETPYALPVASDVDSFFDTYSRYLEALMALPNAREEGASLMNFPWKSHGIIGRDARLVELIREGRFDPLMPGPEEQAWAQKVIHSASS